MAFPNLIEDDTAISVSPVHVMNELKIQLDQAQKRYGIGTGFAPLDEECLQSLGFQSGRISCISGDKETGKSTIALHLVASKLLGSQHGEVCYVDTTGTFDVFRLHQIIMARVALGAGGLEDDASSEADQALQRLRIMRVFDFDGLLDAMKEISHGSSTSELGVLAAGHVRQKHKRPRGREAGEVPDSEDEPLTSSDSERDEEVGDQAAKPPSTIEMLVIDNLTTIVTPLLKSNHVQGQAHLVSFLRSTAEISRNNNMITLILNGISHPPKPASQAAGAPQDAISQMRAAVTSRADTWHPVSIFGANDMRPALGRSFLHFIDFHILLSMLPKSDWDARLLYDKDMQRTAVASVAGQRLDLVHVAEVIADRYHGRIGRWTAFRIDRGFELVAAT